MPSKILKIRVQTRAKRVSLPRKFSQENTALPEGAEELGETMADGTLKIKLKSAPEDGKANKELIKLLSKHFKVSQQKIAIIRGKTSRTKLIEIEQ